MGHIPLLLSLTMQIMGITAVWEPPQCVTNATLMGEYDPSTDSISLCYENISKNSSTVATVVKHELWHGVQKRLKKKDTLFSHPIFNWMCRQFISSEEVMTVITLYPKEEVNTELEARMVTKFLPTVAVAAIGVASEVYSWV